MALMQMTENILSEFVVEFLEYFDIHYVFNGMI